MAGKCVFNANWMQIECYKDWLQCDVADRHKAKCRLCNKAFSIAKMGESGLKSHMKGAKHCELIKAVRSSSILNRVIPATASQSLDNTINNSQSLSEPSTSQHQPSTEKHATVQSYIGNNETLDAEILWALNTVKSHHSYKSNENIGQLFRKMFPDSSIASRFSCGEKKSAYYAVFGLAPHFKNNLLDQLKQNDCYVLLFDESLNHMRQSKQIDVHVRFWTLGGLVKTMFLTSVFLGHATAKDLFENLYAAISPLKLSNVLQISMDGPNVNWKLYEMMQEHCTNEYGKKLLNIGSCGLHVAHNAFRQGFESINWDVEGFLTSIFSLLKDSPARREDYTNVGGEYFPLKFVKHRWIENVSVCERALEIIPHFQKYIEYVEKGKFVKPTCKSFENVQNHIKDKLLPIKLNIFLSVAKLFQPFLEKYQTDKPMIPFLADDLKKIIVSLLQRFLKPIHLANVSVATLHKIDYEDARNHLSTEKVDLGFVAEKKLKHLYVSKKVKDNEMLQLRLDTKAILIRILSKLFDKSPIRYATVRHLACLNPYFLATDKQACLKKMKLLLVSLVEIGIVKDTDCDEIMLDFNDFIGMTVSENLAAFLDFNQQKSRLDDFLSKYIKSRHMKLWPCIEKMLLLSHGQGTVERGFSVNKKIEVENMKEHSYIAQRVICDYLNALGGDITKVIINKELRASVSSARQRYSVYLEEEKQRAANLKKRGKRCLEEKEENEFKKKKSDLEKNIAELMKSADEYAEKAEKENQMMLIMKSNSLRRTAKEKQQQLLELEKLISSKRTV